jgi:hypothetical protein
MVDIVQPLPTVNDFKHEIETILKEAQAVGEEYI